MTDEKPKDNQEILNQVYSDVFLKRLQEHLDPDARSILPENDV